MTLKPVSIQEVQAAILAAPHVLPIGGGTKPALSTPADGEGTVKEVVSLDISSLTGLIEYVPEEFVFTAYAGTSIAEIEAVLLKNGQYLPFDPPLAERGATLGGTIAAGLSGPGRYRYGGVRDFLTGLRYIDGAGQLVRGGGKVVKNAAGFDLPKLMVGSLGSLGVMVELSVKVFPRPERFVTICKTYPGLTEALQMQAKLLLSQLDIFAIDLEPAQDGVTLWTRLGGVAQALPTRVDRLRALFEGSERKGDDLQIIEGESEGQAWRVLREMTWVPQGWSLVKVPLTPARIPPLDAALLGRDILRRYSCGGQLGWLAFPEPPQTLDELLKAQGLSGLAIFGPPGTARLGARVGESFERRVHSAMDPAKRFVEV